MKTADKQPNIVLFGFMGTGKTAVAERLGTRLGLTPVDMDDLIVERAGKPIPEIFAEDGEPHFRELERQTARDVAGRTGLVIATGGGAVLNHDNITDLARTGLAVCLDASPETILERVEGDTNRPLLAVPDRDQKIRDLLNQRSEHYAAVPCHVDTNDLSLDQVAAEIVALYAGKTTP